MLDYLIITIVILVVMNWLQSKPFFWKDAGIPYSIPFPILGSMAHAFFTPLWAIFQHMYDKAGDNKMCGFHLFEVPSLLIKDPDIIKTVTMNESDKFVDRGIHTESYDPAAQGLFFSKGDQWKKYRSKITPYFTPSRIKSMMPLVQPIGDEFAEYMIRESKRGPVDVHAASMKMSVDIVMASVFGLEPDALVDPNSFFYSLQKELISFSFGFKIFLGNLWPRVYRFFGLMVFSSYTTKTLKRFVNDVVDQRLKGVGTRMDFVQGMVDLMQKEEADESDLLEYNEDGTQVARFDRNTVIGQCMIMYVAGTETTGNTLSFLLYELAVSPEIQQRAREEILTMTKRTNNEYGYEDLNELRYTQMIVKEALRKYPTVVFYGRQCKKALTLNSIRIPVGTMVFVSPLALHHDDRFFPEPEKFIPERFEDDSIVTGSYSPFGLGPRSCIGGKFAQTEIILALCKLLPKCRLSTSSRTVIPLRFSDSPTLSPLNGVWLNVEEIK